MEPKPFSTFIQELQNGDVNNELSQGLNDVVKGVDVTDKTGSLILELKISPNKNSTMVFVNAKVKLKIPEGDKPSSVFYIDPSNSNLVRNDPRQMNFSDLETKKLHTEEPEEAKKI